MSWFAYLVLQESCRVGRGKIAVINENKHNIFISCTKKITFFHIHFVCFGNINIKKKERNFNAIVAKKITN